MISVCLATYNGQRFIERQLTSILAQLGPEDEVVVADDGSVDDTLSIIRRLNDSRIRIVDGAHRHSPIWNFEKSLMAAKGDYIFLSDQDDEWMADKVAVTMRYLQDYDCVVSDNKVVAPDGQVIAPSFYASTAHVQVATITFWLRMAIWVVVWPFAAMYWSHPCLSLLISLCMTSGLVM